MYIILARQQQQKPKQPSVFTFQHRIRGSVEILQVPAMPAAITAWFWGSWEVEHPKPEKLITIALKTVH